MKKFLTIALLLIITSFSSSWALNQIKKDLQLIHHKTFKIEPGKFLTLSTESGYVEITPWNRNEIEVKIYGNENAKEKYDFYFDADNQSVKIQGERKKKWNFFSNLRLKYEIKVPAKFNLKISTAGGDIKVGGVDGEISLNTSGGDIWTDRVSGSLKLNTSGGDIKIFSDDASIDAKTSGGDITLEYTGKNKGIELRTSGGDIDINLPSDFNAKVELSTSGGNVSCNFKLNNIEKMSRTKIFGDINNGGNKLIATTSGGDIEVRSK